MSTINSTLSNLKNNLTEEMQIVISCIQDEFSKMREEVNKFSLLFGAKVKEVDDLKCQVKELNEKVTKLEDLIDENDQYERRDCLILSGPALPESRIGENCISIVQEVIRKNCSLNISPTDISTAHRLGRKPLSQLPDKRSVIIKFCRRDSKDEVYRSSKGQNRPKQLYINECLSPMRQKLYKTLRHMRKDHPDLIAGCSTFDGKIYAYTKVSSHGNGPTQKDRRHFIKNFDALKKFCEDFVRRPIDAFLDSWVQRN